MSMISNKLTDIITQMIKDMNKKEEYLYYNSLMEDYSVVLIEVEADYKRMSFGRKYFKFSMKFWW